MEEELNKKELKRMTGTYCKAKDLICQMDLTNEQKIGFSNIFSEITVSIIDIYNKLEKFKDREWKKN